MINRIEELKVGDEVTVTLTGVIYEKVGDDRVYFGREDAPSDWIVIDSDDRAVFELAPRPLPTKDGLYIPANNAENPESSWLYSLMTEFRDNSEWLVYGSDAAVITGNEALLEVRRAHENLGGLVRLVPEQ